MSIADKLLQVNQAKQDIKTAIEGKGVDMSGVPFTNYPLKISEISGGGGGGEVDEYFYYSKTYYTMTNNATLFENAWQDMKDSETVLFDIPLSLAAANQDMGGMTVDLYVGTNGQLQELYDACVNETIPLQISDVCYVNNIPTSYNGDVSGQVGFSFPIYNFGNFNANGSTSFLVADLTPLGMGLGLVLAKIATVSIPNNNIVIQQGFEFENENGIIIPNSVTSISDSMFSGWRTNNQPLVIPDSVTSIGDGAFEYWTSNNQPLVIPDSVTSIGNNAFQYWETNNQPLVIGNSVTSIGGWVFQNWTSNNQPLVIPDSVTSIGNYAFYKWTSNNQPLVIPDSVTSIGNYAFYKWTSNNQPLIIPNSVTSIGYAAFQDWSRVPYIIMEREVPPTIVSDSFNNQNDAPIYVPHDSVDDYKTATNWTSYESRIFSINDKP